MKRQQPLQRPRKKNSNRAALLCVVALAAAASFAGCSEPSKAPVPAAPAPKPAAQPIAPPAPKQEPAAAAGPAQPEQEYSYKPSGRRDPFAPIVVHEEKKELRVAAPPLERYPVVEFKLTGIVWGGFGYNAMLEGPDGKGYFVRMGTIMGQNRGVVKKITKDSLVVEETYKNYMGVTERKDITLMLHKKQEGLP